MPSLAKRCLLYTAITRPLHCCPYFLYCYSWGGSHLQCVSCVRQIAIISTRTKLHLDLYVRPPRVLFRAKNKTNTALLPPSNIPYKLIFFALVSKWVGRANISTIPLTYLSHHGPSSIAIQCRNICAFGVDPNTDCQEHVCCHLSTKLLPILISFRRVIVWDAFFAEYEAPRQITLACRAF